MQSFFFTLRFCNETFFLPCFLLNYKFFLMDIALLLPSLSVCLWLNSNFLVVVPFLFFLPAICD
jgi:hypothetical protein